MEMQSNSAGVHGFQGNLSGAERVIHTRVLYTTDKYTGKE